MVSYCKLVQVNEESFDLKKGNIGMLKRKETRQGWMDGCCHGDNLIINRQKSYIVTADKIVSMTINRACAC